MSDLIKALKQRIELETAREELETGLYTADYQDGVQDENARLQPVLLALCECVKALEAVRSLTDLADVSDALKRLQKVLEEN